MAWDCVRGQLRHVGKWPWPVLCLGLAGMLSGCTTSYYGRGLQYQIETQYAVGDAQFLRSLGNLVGPPIIGGNRVASFNNGDVSFQTDAPLRAANGCEHRRKNFIAVVETRHPVAPR